MYSKSPQEEGFQEDVQQFYSHTTSHMIYQPDNNDHLCGTNWRPDFNFTFQHPSAPTSRLASIYNIDHSSETPSHSSQAPLDSQNKRRTQNRNAQRAFRKRKTDYITNLERELEEVRSKYKVLLEVFVKMKKEVELVEKHIWVEKPEVKWEADTLDLTELEQGNLN